MIEVKELLSEDEGEVGNEFKGFVDVLEEQLVLQSASYVYDECDQSYSLYEWHWIVVLTFYRKNPSDFNLLSIYQESAMYVMDTLTLAPVALAMYVVSLFTCSQYTLM